MRTFGDVSPGGTGTVNVTYSNCNVDGESLTGNATMRIDSFNLSLLIPLDFTISFGRLAMRGTSNVDISGSLRVLVNLGAQSETITENVIALYNTTGRMTKSENLVFIDAYNNLLSPSSYSESINGRVYDSVHGFVDIITVTPLVFSTLSQPFPNSGELLLTGAANARIRATANSATLLVLALDLDNNGAFETQARLNWADLAGAVGANLADSDGDGMHDSWESAFGLNPNANDATDDPDRDLIDNLAEYQGGTRPNVADATLPPPPNPGPLPPGTVSGQIVTLANVSDLVYDSVTQMIYAAVARQPGQRGSRSTRRPARWHRRIVVGTQPGKARALGTTASTCTSVSTASRRAARQPRCSESIDLTTTPSGRPDYSVGEQSIRTSRNSPRTSMSCRAAQQSIAVRSSRTRFQPAAARA